MPYRGCVILFFAASLVAGTPAMTKPKKHVSENVQMRPTPQRMAEIQSALRAHRYEPGSTWEETQEICRKIADEHMWQTDHAPDARVLILLGLAGPHSDPTVAQTHGSRLDKDQRAEAARLQTQNVTLQRVSPSVRSSATSSNPSAPTKTEQITAKPSTQKEKRKASLVRPKTKSKKEIATKNGPHNAAMRSHHS